MTEDFWRNDIESDQRENEAPDHKKQSLHRRVRVGTRGLGDENPQKPDQAISVQLALCAHFRPHRLLRGLERYD